MAKTIMPNSSPYGSAGYGTGSGGTAGRGPAGQFMPEVPLVQGSTGGWQPASTAMGPANAAAAKTRAFALDNQPRLSPAAQDRYNALSQKRTTSGQYDNWLGSGGVNGTTGGTATATGGIGGTGGTGDNIATARANLLNDTSVPLSQPERDEMGGHYTNLIRGMLGGAEVDLMRDAAFKQAGLDYDTQTASANSNLGWGNVGARLNELATGNQMQQSGADLRRAQLIQQLLAG